MRSYRVAASFFFGVLGWVSFIVHGVLKDHLIGQLGDGPTHSLSQTQSYGIFFSLSMSMAACGVFGFWLLLNSKQESHPVMRAVAWPMHISYCIVLVLVWLMAGAEP